MKSLQQHIQQCQTVLSGLPLMNGSLKIVSKKRSWIDIMILWIDELGLTKFNELSSSFLKKGIFEMVYSCPNWNRSPILKKNMSEWLQTSDFGPLDCTSKVLAANLEALVG